MKEEYKKRADCRDINTFSKNISNESKLENIFAEAYLIQIKSQIKQNITVEKNNLATGRNGKLLEEIKATPDFLFIISNKDKKIKIPVEIKLPQYPKNDFFLIKESNFYAYKETEKKYGITYIVGCNLEWVSSIKLSGVEYLVKRKKISEKEKRMGYKNSIVIPLEKTLIFGTMTFEKEFEHLTKNKTLTSKKKWCEESMAFLKQKENKIKGLFRK